jgi:glycosyltransferase involved in cell wall biosynthesis
MSDRCTDRLTDQPLIAWWAAGTQAAAAATLESLRASLGPTLEVGILDRSDGFGAALNGARQARPRADIAIVADACQLTDGWLERVAAAASADDTTVAATTLRAGSGDPLLRGFDEDSVLEGSGSSTSESPVHPRILTLWPHCAYIRAAAFGLLGPFDEVLSHPAAVLAEYAARALGRGLSCALADDVVIQRLPGGLPPCPEKQMARVVALHPSFGAALAEQDALELGPLRRSLVRARTAGRGLSVTVDARALGPTATGTQNYVAGLVLALARSGRVSVRAIVRDDAPDSTVERLRRADVEVVPESEAAGGLKRTDIAHRPQQAFVPEDLRLLRAVGERVVISHLDLIAYRNPAYHVSTDEWRRFRRLTRLALGAADRVIFLSDHARRDAVAEDLVEPQSTSVSGVGVETDFVAEPARRPNAVPDREDLLVMIGSDYMHKNRLFALRLLGELLLRHGWGGMLVLGGAHVEHGGSANAESELLSSRPELARSVIDLGPVSDAEKQWLLRNGSALLCPSTYEGFGLTPLEAAAARIPCVYAATTSLGEVVGSAAATITPWDAAASARAVLPLLRDGKPRDAHLCALRTSLARYRWDSVADRHLEIYRDTIAAPYRSSVPRAWEELLVREQLIVDLDRRYRDIHDRVAFGLRLVDRDGLLTRDQQRGLMRVASRDSLRRPLLGPLGLLGRLGSGDTPASAP